MLKINTVVVPAAGKGTRFYPYTRFVPKELLPILNKPAFSYICDEIITAKLTNLVMITCTGKEGLTTYCDSISDELTTFYVRQQEPRGLGHAILQTQRLIQDDYFCVSLPDDIIVGETPALEQLMRVAQKYNASVIAVQEVPHAQVSAYGIVALQKELEPGIFTLKHLVEKPKPEDAPSCLGIVGRYVLSSKIFESLRHIKPHTNGELQLTDAIAHLLASGEPVIACTFSGTRYDIGTPAGWLHANIALAQETTSTLF